MFFLSSVTKLSQDCETVPHSGDCDPMKICYMDGVFPKESVSIRNGDLHSPCTKQNLQLQSGMVIFTQAFTVKKNAD